MKGSRFTKTYFSLGEQIKKLVRATIAPMQKVVTIGGGTGHARILKSLKDIKGISITAVCPSTDSGGSTGVLREDYSANGYLGDLTRCVAALCADPILAEALMYRYGEGALSGHSVKNLLLLALEKVGGQKEGLEAFFRLCGLGDHRVLPVTLERTQLCAKLEMGNDVVSEANIDTLAKNPLWHPSVHAIRDIYLKPSVSATSQVVEAIEEADHIIISPGDFYSSIMPTLLPKGVKEAFLRTSAKITLVLNIMNKKGETDSYSADDFVTRLENRVGRSVDLILCNDNPIPNEALANYALEEKVAFSSTRKNDPRVRYAPFASLENDGILYHSIEVLQRELEGVVLKDKEGEAASKEPVLDKTF